MNIDNVQTVADCDKCIESLKMLGVDIPAALLAKREELAARNSVYSDYLARNKPSADLVRCIEGAANSLLDPDINALEALKPVMLYGKIQSGKTRAFVGIMSIAFDRGVDIVIVYTKGTNALATQTVSRMKAEFKHFQPGDDLRQKCTIVVHDVLDFRRQLPTPYELNTRRHVIVCKKESNNTRLLKEIFEANSLMRLKKVVVIDDEADFGGISFYRDSRAGGIRAGANAMNITMTVKSIPDCRNMLVTATPYALYLQTDGMSEVINGEVRPLRPRHTEMVPVHKYYVGGKQYFIDSTREDSMYHSVFHPLSQECIDVLGNRDARYLKNISSSPKLHDFRYAVLQYLVATAIRSIQEESLGCRYRSSFIMHVQISKDAHVWQRDLTSTYLDYLKGHIFCEKPDTCSFAIIDIGNIYEEFASAREKGESEGLVDKCIVPSLDQVTDRIRALFERGAVHVQIVNSDEDVANLLDVSGQLELRHEVNIFVGGSILDRGITIVNLIGFLYGRSPQRMQMDTVLQHARMYGARAMEDMVVTRFHTSNLLYERLRRINAMDEALRDEFEKAMLQGVDPQTVFICREQNGRIVPTAPNRLLIASISTIVPQSRHLPVGFQTDCHTKIHGTVLHIDSMICESADYQNRDGDGFFMIDRDLAISILRLIRLTYIYNRPIDKNTDLDWDVEETISILEWALDGKSKLYCLRRENRELSRYRENGGFIDAPDDGRYDLAPAREKAIDIPVLMLIRENGSSDKGWRDTPFYWPVLLVQQNVKTAVYGTAGR